MARVAGWTSGSLGENRGFCCGAADVPVRTRVGVTSAHSENLECHADNFVSTWPESWLLPFNSLAIRQVGELQRLPLPDLFEKFAFSPDIVALVSILGEEGFRRDIGGLIADARDRRAANLEQERALAAEADRLRRVEEARLSGIRDQQMAEDRARRAEERRKAEEAERLRLAAAEQARLEAERRHQERLAHIRQTAAGWFETDFLNADRHFSEAGYGAEDQEAFTSAKVEFVQLWMSNLRDTGAIDQIPDREQSQAIATVNGDVKVTARAGSGKTSTTVLRAYFLIQHCRVPAGSILMLAFNRAAALEVRKRMFALLAPHSKNDFLRRLSQERRSAGGRLSRADIERAVLDEMESELGVAMPIVSTFHSLARALADLTGNIIYDDEDAKNLVLTDLVNDIVREKLDDEMSGEKIRSLLLRHFREDWEKVSSDFFQRQGADLLGWMRSLPQVTLNGDYVKSGGEKAIGDWLFEHGIEHQYEQPRFMNGYLGKPDFTIPNRNGPNIIVEYFGLEGTSGKYDRDIIEKREYWSRQKNFTLVELYKWHFDNRTLLEAELRHRLTDAGVPTERLSDEELWTRLEAKARLRYSKAVSAFIIKARQLGLSWRDLTQRSEAAARDPESSFGFASPIEQDFVRQAIHILSQYEKRLAPNVDFPQLLADASARVRAGFTTFTRRERVHDLRDLRYLFVDEFQDFSFQFQDLVSSIREVNPGVAKFAVGDDWQAINGFAGSDLKYFREFGPPQQGIQEVHIPTNYRSVDEVVEFGNAIMHGLGAPAAASRAGGAKVKLGKTSQINLSDAEKSRFPNDTITPALLRLIHHEARKNRSIVLLSRTENIPYRVNSDETNANSLKGFLRHLRGFLPESTANRVSISTAHKYKGLQKQTVILLDGTDRRFPLIHPDWVFSRILGSDLDAVVDEERRLLYVACTRAEEQLYILSEDDSISPFLQSAEVSTLTSTLHWGEFEPAPMDSRDVYIKFGNTFAAPRDAGTWPIRAALRQRLGCMWMPDQQCWQKAVPARDFNVDALIRELAMLNVDGRGPDQVSVSVTDSNFGLVYASEAYEGTWIPSQDRVAEFSEYLDATQVQQLQ